MVGPFYFALKSRLAGIAGRNKLLINMKAHLQRCAFCFAFGSGFKVWGSRGGFAAFLEDGILASQPSPLGEAYKVSQSPVIPLISGE